MGKSREVRLSGKIQFTVKRKNVPSRMNRDYYHDLLTLSWTKTLILFFLTYLLINSVFATLYWLAPSGLINSDGSWLSSFYFSVQTLSTIGYGNLSPATTFSNTLVTIEAALGMIIMAIMTGFFFAKFSRPFAKVEFSRNLVIGNHNGKRHLMLRMVNIRKNQIVDSKVSLVWLRPITTKEGQEFRTFVDLTPVRSTVPIFSMSMLVMHEINESSPLYGLEEKDISQLAGEILVNAIGTDSTYGQTIHANQFYDLKRTLFGYRFKDMVEIGPDGARTIDFAQFHEIVKDSAPSQ